MPAQVLLTRLQRGQGWLTSRGASSGSGRSIGSKLGEPLTRSRSQGEACGRPALLLRWRHHLQSRNRIVDASGL
jgi:hypothetical protein